MSGTPREEEARARRIRFALTTPHPFQQEWSEAHTVTVDDLLWLCDTVLARDAVASRVRAELADKVRKLIAEQKREGWMETPMDALSAVLTLLTEGAPTDG